ncbi:protein kinase family protein [Mesobacillus maritimus]|uniref:protein kinase domain-containing protein n=1 Tax=Mesobacillus maritimus TaxID=1643336 RepID=UPI00203C7D45|nr:protein kinase family protein [Mesobacillus maritimus]MCM3588553.1 protein kinase family protein [Mesobacillus maritimus]
MMNNSLKSLSKIRSGTIISGKWHGKRYTIIKELGAGANGVVYLVRASDRQAALKISDNPSSITSEVNVLKSFNKVQGSALGPSLLDVDDWNQNGHQYSFYVMEFIKGPDFLSFVQQKGPEWLEVLVLQLLSDLEILHQNGWIFGDLKPENLLVTGPPARIRCIDVGGTTLNGRAIKEFTEFYDRGYWGMGSRKADVGYDLFAVAMIIINTAYPKRFNKTTGGESQLMEMVRRKPELKRFEPMLKKALLGKYASAAEMKSHMLGALRPSQKQSVSSSTPKSRTQLHQKKYRTAVSKPKKKSRFLETLLLITAVSMIYVFYLYIQVL